MVWRAHKRAIASVLQSRATPLTVPRERVQDDTSVPPESPEYPKCRTLTRLEEWSVAPRNIPPKLEECGVFVHLERA